MIADLSDKRLLVRVYYGYWIMRITENNINSTPVIHLFVLNLWPMCATEVNDLVPFYLFVIYLLIINVLINL